MALPDPRRYGRGDPEHVLLKLAEKNDAHELRGALRELALAKRDVEIEAGLVAASSQTQYARLWDALCDAVERPVATEAIATRVFAIPWILVCGASASAVLSCVLRDVDAIVQELQQHGTFGASRNVGLSNAMCGVDSLEALAPSEVLSGWEHPRVRNVEPAPIQLVRGAEEVHVRFLLGAAVASSAAPDIRETGSNVGAWGTPALRKMVEQLATADVQVLPIPRPPAGLYTAAYAGRWAGVETAFNLFMSHAVRRFRSVVGDPSVTLSAHAGSELRVTLSSAFDASMTEGFRWPLHPADSLENIESTIVAMVGDCRLDEPRLVPSVLPDRTTSGAVFFPSTNNS